MHVLIAGGGIAGLEALIALRSLAGGAVRLTLLSPEAGFVHQPMSVGVPFAVTPGSQIPLERVAAEFGAAFVKDSMAEVRADEHVVVTGEGEEIAYDKLIVAAGAPRAAVYPNATTFRGAQDVERLHGLVQDVEAGIVRRIAFVIPAGVAWTLPAYELALMTARRAYEMCVEVELSLVTPEDRPLSVFGAKAADDLERLLEEAGIRLFTGAVAAVPAKGSVLVHPGDERIECDRVVALPVTHGPEVRGLPADSGGFIPTDRFARVAGVRDVYAAGDGTNFPLKQGGIACQQADAAASHIAAAAGVSLEPEPFRPVLRGRLLTGDAPLYMRRDLSGRLAGREESGGQMLWWPGTKVAGKYLAGYLADSDDSTRENGPKTGFRRRALLSAATAGFQELPLRGYEYARWA